MLRTLYDMYDYLCVHCIMGYRILCTVYSVVYFTFCIGTYCSMLLYSSLNYRLIRNQLWLSRDPFKGFLISQQGFSHFLFWSLCCLTVSTGRNMNQTFHCLSDSARLRTGSKRFSHVRSYQTVRSSEAWYEVRGQ